MIDAGPRQPRPARNRADFVLGACAIALAAVYLVAASAIPDSLLADAVGAAGVPRLVGWTTGVVGFLLCLRSIRSGNRPTAEDLRPAWLRWRGHALAAGLTGLLAAYVVLVPPLGYAVSIALLTGAVAWYAGAPFDARLGLVSLASGVVFWVLFVAVLGLPMPSGALFGGR